MPSKNDNYVIKGTVLGKSGKALAGFEVTALDKDLMGSDLLGSSKTDGEGRFEICYTEAQFAGFLEKGPDVYLLVKNDQGQAVHFTENAIRNNAGHEEVYHIVLDDAEALTPSVSLERSRYQRILAQNPNYFGTMPTELSKGYIAVISKWNQHTQYEELDCVGLRRRENVLEAVFHVKRPQGYGGPRCGDGSKEWVTFWVDYQDGNGWIQAGPPVSVTVHDLSVADEKGIWYAAQLNFQPAVDPTTCKRHQVVRLRAILSWSVPHFNPNTLPVWGNRKDAWIFLKSKRRFFPPDFAVQPTEFAVFDNIQPAPIASLNHAIALHKELGAGIEQAQAAAQKGDTHRVQMHSYLAKNFNYYGNFSLATSAEGIQTDLAKLPNEYLKLVTLPDNWLDLIPVFPQLEKTKYEQVTCLGLFPEVDLLESTIAIKLPTGYLTDPCFVGSTEYVAYYIDYGMGWEYVGTDKFQVHDVADDLIEPIPAKKPLMYASRMQVKGMRKRALACSKEQVIMARAILSWNVDPTLGGPHFPPIWGNVIDRRIEVMPGLSQVAQPRITEVSDVDVASINAAGLAETDALGHIKPFGADLGIWGNVNVAGATHYRLQYRKVTDIGWTDGMASRAAQRPGTSFTDLRLVTGDGWFSITDYLNDLAEYSSTMLCRFVSAGLDGPYELRLQVGNGIIVSNSSDPVTVLIDNKAPSLYRFAGETIPNVGVTVKNACGLYKGTEDITVWGNFEDDHYAFYQLSLVGGGITSPQSLPSPAVGASGTFPAGDFLTGQILTTFKMPDVHPQALKCAYAILITVHDHTIAGYAGHYAFGTYPVYTTSSVTFDWEP